MIDEDGLVIAQLVAVANRDILYRSADVSKGQFIQELLPMAEADEIMATVRSTLETDESNTLHYQLTVPAGPRWFEGRTSLLDIPVAGKRCVVWCARDITARKEAEEELRESEAALRQAHDNLESHVTERTAELAEANARLTAEAAERVNAETLLREERDELEQLYQTAPVGLAFLDRDCRYVRINDRLAALEGRPAAEYIGLMPRDFLPEALANDVQAFLRRVIDSGEPLINLEMSSRSLHVVTNYYPMVAPDGTVRGVSVVVQDITDRKAVEDELRREKYLLAQSQRIAGVWSWSLDVDTQNAAWTPETYRLFGVSPDTFTPSVESFMGLVHPDDRRAAQAWVEAAVAGHPPGELTFRIIRPDGATRRMSSQCEVVSGDGIPARLVGTSQDITDRLQLEAQLVQAQKLDTVGRLAGGIAHDFNNLLAVINGTTELALLGLKDGDPVHADLMEIGQAGASAVTLVRQLLAFSRQQLLAPVVASLSAEVRRVQPICERLIGADIALVARLAEGKDAVRADAGQLQQVLVNLVINARDAMPRGGTLTLEVETVHVEEGPGAHQDVDLPAGPTCG